MALTASVGSGVETNKGMGSRSISLYTGGGVGRAAASEALCLLLRS